MRASETDLADLAAANRRFAEEARRFSFHFQCPSCAHFAPATGTCSMDFPNAMLMGQEVALTERGAIAFCKYFELGESAGPAGPGP